VVAVSVGTSVGRSEVSALCGQLREALCGGEGVRLDVSATASLSPALAQLIVAAGRAAQGAGVPFVLVSPRAELVDGFQELGLFGELMTLSME
jgi:anti-anti-sigma regulatory factor